MVTEEWNKHGSTHASCNGFHGKISDNGYTATRNNPVKLERKTPESEALISWLGIHGNIGPTITSKVKLNINISKAYGFHINPGRPMTGGHFKQNALEELQNCTLEQQTDATAKATSQQLQQPNTKHGEATTSNLKLTHICRQLLVHYMILLPSTNPLAPPL